MNKKDEGNNAPIPDQWYTLTLGSSFKDHQPSSNFCTLRYEFKPASIDKTQPGALHKSKDNKISVEFNNNQPGKPKVTFEGTSEDYKENDAVLFFDGHTLRLERLHRAVKRLRHVRLPGESVSAAVLPSSAEAGSSPLGRGVKVQPPPPPQPQPQSQGFGSRNSFAAPPPPPPLRGPVSVEVERIDIGDGGNSGGKSKVEKSASNPPPQSNVTPSPDSKDFDLEEHLDIMIDDDDETVGPSKNIVEDKAVGTGIDINMPQQNDTDDEIADVDVNDDNGVNGSTAAAELWAQVHAVERKEPEPTSSSSTSSGSESSGSSSESGSGSSHSSSESESSDGDSVSSI